MKNNEYSRLLSKSDSERDAEEMEFQIEEAEQQLNSDITATKRSLANARRSLAAAKIKQPFNSGHIVEAQVAVEGFELGLQRLEKLHEELFSVPAASAQDSTQA